MPKTLTLKIDQYINANPNCIIASAQNYLNQQLLKMVESSNKREQLTLAN
jgi:hypothetical protein